MSRSRDRPADEPVETPRADLETGSLDLDKLDHRTARSPHGSITARLDHRISLATAGRRDDGRHDCDHDEAAECQAAQQYVRDRVAGAAAFRRCGLGVDRRIGWGICPRLVHGGSNLLCNLKPNRTRRIPIGVPRGRCGSSSTRCYQCGGRSWRRRSSFSPRFAGRPPLEDATPPSSRSTRTSGLGSVFGAGSSRARLERPPAFTIA